MFWDLRFYLFSSVANTRQWITANVVTSLINVNDQPVDETEILAVLRGVMDPELHDNIVDLGMVRSVSLEGETAHITIALTTAGCPLRATIKRDCETRVESLPGINAVPLHWDELTPEERTRVMERA